MRRITPALAAPVVLLSACGGSSAPAETVPADADVVVRAVTSLKFDRADYGTVAPGDVVVAYANEEAIRHTLIIARDNEMIPSFKLVVASKGSVDSATVNLEPGGYVLLCDVPGHSNMKATLTVAG